MKKGKKNKFFNNEYVKKKTKYYYGIKIWVYTK